MGTLNPTHSLTHQALSFVLILFWECICFALFSQGHFYCVTLFCALWLFGMFQVQVIVWRLLSEMTYNVLIGILNCTQSLTRHSRHTQMKVIITALASFCFYVAKRFTPVWSVFLGPLSSRPHVPNCTFMHETKRYAVWHNVCIHSGYERRSIMLPDILTDAGCRSWGLWYLPLKICRRVTSTFWLTKMSHSSIQNCCWITLQVSRHQGWKTCVKNGR